MNIPVTTAKVMLPEEAPSKLEQMSPPNRWIPVLKRYIGLAEGRIWGLVENPDA